MAGGDADDCGGDDAGMGFKCTSDRCNWFTIVRGLACQSGGVVDRGILLFDFTPHMFARRERGRRDRLSWRCRETAVPVESLCAIRAVLGPGIVWMEREVGERG